MLHQRSHDPRWCDLRGEKPLWPWGGSDGCLRKSSVAAQASLAPWAGRICATGAGKGAPSCPPLSSPSGVEPVPLWSPGRGNPCPPGRPFLRLSCPPQPQGPLLGAVPCLALPRRPSGTPGPSLVYPLALDTARPRNNTHSPLC